MYKHTKWSGNRAVYANGANTTNADEVEALNQLYRYESTDLTPEKINALQSENAQLKAKLDKAVDDIADFIAEYDDCIKIAIDTQDRHYLEAIIKQWRGSEDIKNNGGAS